MAGNALAGSFPVVVFTLHELRSLDLGGNGMTGQLPVGWRNYTMLHDLDLSKNRLSGRPLSMPELHHAYYVFDLSLALTFLQIQ